MLLVDPKLLQPWEGRGEYLRSGLFFRLLALIGKLSGMVAMEVKEVDNVPSDSQVVLKPSPSDFDKPDSG